MTTLLAVYNSEGCVGRCDANCYQATSPRCSCICGGRNHSAGVQRAIENTAGMVDRLPGDLECFAEARGFKCEDLVVIDRMVVPDARQARNIAYLRLNQLELPFDEHADV